MRVKCARSAAPLVFILIVPVCASAGVFDKADLNYILKYIPFPETTSLLLGAGLVALCLMTFWQGKKYLKAKSRLRRIKRATPPELSGMGRPFQKPHLAASWAGMARITSRASFWNRRK